MMWRMCSAVLLWQGTAFGGVLLALLVGLAWKSLDQSMLRQKSASAINDLVPSQALCVAAEQVRICSHQAVDDLVSPNFFRKSLVHQALDLVKVGVHCFDIDILSSADDVLVVGHPSRLARATGLEHLGQDAVEVLEGLRIADWRKAGAGAEEFPEFWSFLMAVGRETYSENNSQAQMVLHIAETFIFAVELKGRLGRGAHPAAHFSTLCGRHWMVGAPALVLWQPRHDVANTILDKGDRADRGACVTSLVLPLRDRGGETADLLAAEAIRTARTDGYALLGPSLKLARGKVGSGTAAEALRSSLLPTMVWDVNDAEGFIAAALTGAAVVVSDHPRELSHLRSEILQSESCRVQRNAA